MADNTQVKSLFQWKLQAANAKPPNDHETIRMVFLLQADTLREMLKALEANPTAGAIAVGQIPCNHMEVVIEAYDPDKVEKSKLTYTKYLLEPGFRNDHVNLV